MFRSSSGAVFTKKTGQPARARAGGKKNSRGRRGSLRTARPVLYLFLFTCLFAALLASPALARLVFDPRDPAFDSSSVLPLDPTSGFAPGMMSHSVTLDGVRIDFTTASPRGLYGVGAGFWTNRGTTTITFTPPVAAAGIEYVSGDGGGGTVLVHGSLGDESFHSSPFARNLFIGAADIGDINQMVVSDIGGTSRWNNLRFTKVAPTPPPGAADLALNMSGPATQSGGATILYSLDVQNNGPAAAARTEIADFLPPGSSFASSSLSTTSVAGGQVVLLDGGDLPPGANGGGFLSLVPPPFDKGGFVCESILLNAARVTSATVDPTLDNNMAFATTVFENASRASMTEVCDNGIDDNCDGLADCADPACGCTPQFAGITVTRVPPPPPPAPPAATPTPAIGPRGYVGDEENCWKMTPGGYEVVVPIGCCDPTFSVPESLCEPVDPNFKESDPPVNAFGYGYTEAGRRMTYTIHYENVGGVDAHDVTILDPLDEDLDASTLQFETGDGVYDPATRTIRWTDAVVPPATPRSVSFSVQVRADAPPQTRVRNVATIIFPDASPPSRIDTNAVEHAVVDPAHPVAPDLKVFGCTAEGAGQWRVNLVNEGYGFAYNVTAAIVNPPPSVQVGDGLASFAHPGDPPDALPTVIALAATSSADSVSFNTDTPGDPCGALTWRITYLNSRGETFTRDVQDAPDRDRDAVPDAADNCPDTYNPTQTDVDADGRGDACDNAPPNCGGAYTSVREVWSPNHRKLAVSILGVTDPDGDPVTITIDRIMQDEPTQGQGDGNTCPDAYIPPHSSTAYVLAERSGTGNGRVYTIYFTATDSRGASCRGSVKVSVPHDQGGSGAVDDGPLYNSTVCSGKAQN